MEILYDNQHTIEFVEELLIEYVITQVEKLNKTLRQNGIEDKDLRQKICEEFFFDFSDFIDNGWIEKNKKVFSPLICFAEFQNQDSFGIGEINFTSQPRQSRYTNQHQEIQIGILRKQMKLPLV